MDASITEAAPEAAHPGTDAASAQPNSPTFSWRSSLMISLLITAAWLLVRLVLLNSLGIPDPKVHDEFNYILGADTFAHGRLTNPPHPLSAFLASPHTLYEPTYSSKYPPGQSLFLAAGQVLFGHPFYGVLIEGALMIFLLCLALCLWTSRLPAALVSIALAIFFQPPMYWVDSYWGGSAAVCGAALLMIAIAWFKLSANPFAGCVFALGGVLLFITRPYEGAFTFFAALILSLFVLDRRKLLRAAAYGVPVALIGILGIAAHNFAVTRNPLMLPRQLYESRYMVAPIFIFQGLRHPNVIYPNERLAAEHSMNGWEVSAFREGMSVQHGYPGHLVTAIRFAFNFFPQLPFLLLGLAWFDRRLWFCLAVLGAGIVGNSLVAYESQHYIAPSVPALALILGVMVERALPLRQGKIPVGAIAVPIILFAAVSPSIGAALRERGEVAVRQTEWPHERTELIRRLSAEHNPSLVIVHYPTPWWRAVEEEWVWNGAEIDRQPVVFAHDLGASKNPELLNYYRNRTPWLLTFDPNNPDKYCLSPYPR